MAKYIGYQDENEELDIIRNKSLQWLFDLWIVTIFGVSDFLISNQAFINLMRNFAPHSQLPSPEIFIRNHLSPENDYIKEAVSYSQQDSVIHGIIVFVSQFSKIALINIGLIKW